MPFHSSKGHSCHLNLIPSFHCHPIIPSSFWPTNLIHVSSHHLNVIPLTIAHGDNIQSFGCHSIHSIVIWGFEMTRDENIVEWQEWCWNDVLVIWNTFPSFLSSQMSGQNWGNCRFHPCHPEVIPSFECHSKILNQWENAPNDVGMTDDFRICLTTFP